MSIEARLAELGLSLPPAPQPLGAVLRLSNHAGVGHYPGGHSVVTGLGLQLEDEEGGETLEG